MAIWEAATIISGEPGGRVNVDAEGVAFVKFLAPQFRQDDGTEHGFIGYGIVTIGEPEPEEE
jgi:hypothetical protein